MSDGDFRAAASLDLDQALTDYGYVLNERETELVHKFRTTLAEAGMKVDGVPFAGPHTIWPEAIEKMAVLLSDLK